MNSSEWRTWSARDARRFLVVPSEVDHKYSRGVLGVVTGSNQYPGAAVLGCEAAARTGVGMIRFYGPQFVEELVLRQRPEVVIEDGKVQAWLLGSGIDGKNPGWLRTRRMKSALKQRLPTVLDAGALPLLPFCEGATIITPHYRELHQLLESRKIASNPLAIEGDPKKWARIAADEFNVVVLLKGHITVIASPTGEIQLPPSPTWLATAGTGDVLGGILGALLATQREIIKTDEEALLSIAATGALIHARAGELASGGGPITAMDLALAIPKVITALLR